MSDAFVATIISSAIALCGLGLLHLFSSPKERMAEVLQTQERQRLDMERLRLSHETLALQIAKDHAPRPEIREMLRETQAVVAKVQEAVQSVQTTVVELKYIVESLRHGRP